MVGGMRMRESEPPGASSPGPGHCEPQGARKRHSITRTVLVWSLIALGVAMMHETGHHVAFSLFGSSLEQARVFPGLQVYPQLRWCGWDANFFFTSYSDIPGVAAPDWRYGLCVFMGSGAAALAAYVALAILLLTNAARRWARALTAVVLLGAADILCYSLVPVLGIRYGLPFAGEVAEPYRGALEMGVAPVAYWSLLVTHAAAAYGLLLLAWKRGRGRSTAAG